MNLLQSIEQQFKEMLVNIIKHSPQVLAGVLVGLLTFVIAQRVRRTGKKLADRIEAPEQVERLIINLLYALSIIVGLAVALSVMGVNVYGLVAGLGISGLIVGFALKDILENLLAGVLVLLQQPFNLGDYIEVGDHLGTVIDVALRDTTLRTLDNVKVSIPNRIVYTTPIVNYTAYPMRRREVKVGIGYGQDIGRALHLILEAAAGVDGVVVDDETMQPALWLNSLDDSALAATLYFWIDMRTHSLLAVHSAVVNAVQAVADREGINLPYPTQVVQVRQLPPES